MSEGNGRESRPIEVDDHGRKPVSTQPAPCPRERSGLIDRILARSGLSPSVRVLLGFGLATAVLLIVVSASIWTTARLKDSARSAAHAHEMVETVTELHAQLQIVQNGVRSYLESGAPQALEESHQADRRMQDCVDALRGLIGGNRGLQERIDTLEALLKRRADLHDQLVAGQEALMGVQPTTQPDIAETSRLSDEIHRMLDVEIAQDERARLAEGVDVALHRASAAVLINGISGMLGIAVVLVAGVITLRDVRGRNRAEALARQIAENIQEVFFVYSADARQLLYVSPTYEKLWGRSCDSLHQQPGSWLDSVVPEDRPFAVSAIHFECQAEQETEYRLKQADGSVRHIWSRSVPVRNEQGKVYRVIRTATDITDRKRTEEALLLRDRALEAFVQGVCITDPTRPDNPVVWVNRAFEPMTGYSRDEIMGRNCRFLQGPETDPAAVAVAREAIANGQPCLVELLNYRKDGTPFWNALSLSPIHDSSGKLTHFVGVQTDITPFKRLEAQFLQSQKMEAVGRLAGGIAHDFNNLLTIITGYSALVLDALTEQHPSAALVEEIRKAGDRAADLTRQLLAFSRKQLLQPRVLDLNHLVENVQKMLARLIGENIELRTELAPCLGRIKADPGQIEQILVNLAVNARDAMPDGGTLTLQTQSVEVSEEAVALASFDLVPGSYATLEMSDTGLGMDKATLARIFEPFFTTKGPAKGTGLGLATVYGIVKQSGGFIHAESQPGQGARFRIYLPVVPDSQVEAEMAATQSPLPRGTEKVLVVEDEAGVRLLARQILQRNGYDVMEAPNGEEALRVADGHEGAIDLLLTDMVMPQLGGRALAERLSAIYPQMRVLYMSGYTDDAMLRSGTLAPGNDFLSKPFTVDAMLRKVRDVLDKRHGGDQLEMGDSESFRRAIGPQRRRDDEVAGDRRLDTKKEDRFP